MKTITLIRHAKSSWKFSGLADRDRPLNKRGQRDAPMMAARLAADGFSPQYIISSPALRALRTAEAFAEAVALHTRHLVIDPVIYGADTRGLLQLIQGLDADTNSAALVGHNPEMTDLVCRLSGTRIDNVPTCGVAQLHYCVDRWSQIGPCLKPDVFVFDCPKHVRD